MAAVVSTPVSTWAATLMALSAGGVSNSGSITVTVHVTAGWEIQIPIQFSHVTASADPVVKIYASMDGGLTFDSNPFTSFSLGRNWVLGAGAQTGSRQTSIRLTTGQYCLQLTNAGPYSSAFAVLTQLVVTAVQNV